MRRFLWLALGLLCGLPLTAMARTDASQARCIVPARPGGGYDLTCRILQASLDDIGALPGGLKRIYMPGGIGAVTFEAVVEQSPDDAGAIVAFSSGSLLNLLSGRLSKYGPDSVRWLAAIGIDHGMIAVDAKSPYRTLKDLVVAMKADPRKVVFGVGGSAGNQDWMKAALLARRAGIDRNAMRYVAFEGGGEAMAALLTGHVQVVPGDIGEAVDLINANKIRVLAVLSEQRLPGRFAWIPTAREQGLDVQWPIVRGFYMGPKVPDADVRRWADTLHRATASAGYSRAMETHGLLPVWLTGADLDAYIKERMRDYRQLAREFNLIK